MKPVTKQDAFARMLVLRKQQSRLEKAAYRSCSAFELLRPKIEAIQKEIVEIRRSGLSPLEEFRLREGDW